MRTWIWKYDGSTKDSYMSRPPLVDKIEIRGALDIPILNDELHTEGNVFELRSGDFDITFSNLQPEKSFIGNLSIRDFLFTGRSNIFLLITELEFKSVTTPYSETRRVGIIDIPALENNLTYSQNHNEIQVPCIGIMGDIVRFYKQIPINQNAGNAFDFFIDNLFATGSSATGVRLVNELDINDRVGFPVLVNQSIQRQLFLTHVDYSKWSLFENFSSDLGFAFKALTSGQNNMIDYDFPPIYMLVRWRDEGRDKTINIIEHIEGFNSYNRERYILFVTGLFPVSESKHGVHGLLASESDFKITKIGDYNPSGLSQYFELRKRTTPDPPPLPYWDLKIIGIVPPGFPEVITYDNILLVGARTKGHIGTFGINLFKINGQQMGGGQGSGIAWTRIFVRNVLTSSTTQTTDEGNEIIVEKTTAQNYNYLLFQSEPTKRIKAANIDLALLDKVAISGQNYFIDKINNIDFRERTTVNHLTRIS